MSQGFPRFRFALALLLGHVAAAICFAACISVVLATTPHVEPDMSPSGSAAWAPWMRALVRISAGVAALASVTALLMVPISAVGAVIAWQMVADGRVGAWFAAMLGGAVGLLLGTPWLWLFFGFPWSVWGFAGGMEFVGEALAGAVYSWIVWRVAIAPRAPSRKVAAGQLAGEA